MRFYITDAFTDQIFGGNPAGVVLLDPGADYPTEEMMIKIAAELRYSETAFIRPLNQGEFQFRYFTPAAEVDLCGHATIGSFAAMLSGGLVKQGKTYTIHTLSGPLSIDLTSEHIMMDMAEGKHISTIDDPEALAELYGVMGLSWMPGDRIPNPIDQDGCTKPLLPAIISTGLPDILLPVKNRAELARIAPNFPALSALSKRYGVIGVHAFTLEDPADGATAHCRNFAPLYDIDEEAATGTANGGLTFYLHLNRIIPNRAACCFVQGEAMGRPSKIFSALSCINARPAIQVGGGGAVLARGEIDLD